MPLAEIDTPEKEQPFGQRSKESLADLCFRVMATIKPQTIDRYGRTVALVECRGKDANLEQVGAGMALAYTKYQTDHAVFRAELNVRRERVRLWRDAEPVERIQWPTCSGYPSKTTASRR